MTGGVNYLADEMSYDDEEVQDYRDEDFGTQEEVPYPNEPDQGDLSIDFSILGSPEVDSAYHDQNPSSNAGALVGMTGGSDVSTILTQTIGATSPQLHHSDNPLAVNQHHHGWESNEDIQPLYNFISDNSHPTVEVSDYDASQGTVHRGCTASEWWTDATANDPADLVAVGAVDQRMQPLPNGSSSLATPYQDRFHWSHQMNRTIAGPSAVVLQAPTRNSRRPRSEIVEQDPAYDHGNQAENYEPPFDGMSTTGSSGSYPWNTITPETWQSELALRPQLHDDTIESGVRHGRHVPHSRGLSRSLSNRLSVPEDPAFTYGPPSPAPSNISAPSSVAGALECGMDGCNQTFTGIHGRGNRHRHWRLKHGHGDGPEERLYPCEASGCPKFFKRQDARLKHHRKQHPHLAHSPALSRKKSPST